MSSNADCNDRTDVSRSLPSRPCKTGELGGGGERESRLGLLVLHRRDPLDSAAAAYTAACRHIRGGRDDDGVEHLADVLADAHEVEERDPAVALDPVPELVALLLEHVLAFSRVRCRQWGEAKDHEQLHESRKAVHACIAQHRRVLGVLGVPAAKQGSKDGFPRDAAEDTDALRSPVPRALDSTCTWRWNECIVDADLGSTGAESVASDCLPGVEPPAVAADGADVSFTDGAGVG